MKHKHYFFDIETRCGLGVAVHAAMCADPTLTPDQTISIARHVPHDQLIAYATAAGVDLVELTSYTIYFDELERIVDGRFMALDTGLRPGVSVIRVTEPAELMVREFDVRAPRAAPKRDWEQRLKKQRRR